MVGRTFRTEIDALAETNQNTAADRDEPNETTAQALEEGRRIAYDKSIKGYSSIEELKATLEI